MKGGKNLFLFNYFGVTIFLCTFAPDKHQEQSPYGGLANRAFGATVVSTMRKQYL